MINIGVEHCASFVSSQFKPGVGRAGAVRRAVTISRQAGSGAAVVAGNWPIFCRSKPRRMTSLGSL